MKEKDSSLLVIKKIINIINNSKGDWVKLKEIWNPFKSNVPSFTCEESKASSSFPW